MVRLPWEYCWLGDIERANIGEIMPKADDIFGVPAVLHHGLTAGTPLGSGPFLRQRQMEQIQETETPTMADHKTLQDLFLDTVKDVYYAEKQIVKALQKMERAAQSDQVKKAFDEHREQTERHVERLDKIFEMLGVPARGKTCDGILGIIEEGKTIMDEYKGTEALDAGLIASAQAVEHYEMARYGTLKAWAQQLGMNDAYGLLEETYKEESETDKKLSQMAMQSENRKAAA